MICIDGDFLADSIPVLRFLEERIAEIEHVLDCYLMAGGEDYQMKVIARSLDDYEQLVRQTIHKIPGIASMETSFAYGVVKQSRGLPVSAAKQP